MYKISIRDLMAHKRCLVGTGSAVLLGIAFLAGTLVLGDSLRAGFDDTFSQANAGTDAVVRGVVTMDHGESSQRRLLEASLVDALSDVDGVASAQPSIEGIAQLSGADGEPIGGGGPPTLARNWIDDVELNPFRIADGRGPRADGEVVIDRATAEAGDLAVGDTTVVRTPDPVEVRIVGIATFGAADGMGAGFTFFTLDDARRHLLDGSGRLTSVLLTAGPDVAPGTLVERVRPLLAEGTEVLTGAALAAEQTEDINGDFLDAFETFLLMFTGIALLVATFSIYNTFSVILAQRSRESALLRALGASRRQVLGSIAVEAAVVGLLASAVGVVAGIGLAAGLQALMDAAGFGLPTASLVVGTDSVVISVAIGLIVTLVASLAPAIRASRVAPLAALREVTVDHSGASRVRAIAGCLTLTVGLALVLGPALAGAATLALVGLGAVSTIIGLVVLGPVAARPAAGLLGLPLPAFSGIAGVLARRNAQRDPKRTAATASALMVGVGVVTLFTVFGASIKSTIDDSVARSFTGDLVISAEGFSGSGLSPSLAEEIATLPDVETAAGLGYGAARVGGRDGAFSVADPSELSQVLDLDVTAGSVADMTGHQLAVSQATADEEGWQLGTSVPVDFPDGTSAELTVAAVYAMTDNVGPLLLPASVWSPHATQPSHAAVLIDVAAGSDVAGAGAAVTEVAERYGAPAVQDRQEYIATMAGDVDRFLTIVYVLLALSIVIALMGIANTLSLSIHERTRELGLLRAVGQTRGQLRAMVRWESVLIATFGTLGGVALGLFLGWGMVRVAMVEAGFGSFALPVIQLGVIGVVGTLVGVLAGLRPARRAARLDVLGAIDAE